MDRWDVELLANRRDDRKHDRLLVVESSSTESSIFDSLEKGDIVDAMNGYHIGEPAMDTLQKVLNYIRGQTDVILEVRRLDAVANVD